jgi:2'-hydroxyisoflavone reductase
MLGSGRYRPAASVLSLPAKPRCSRRARQSGAVPKIGGVRVLVVGGTQFVGRHFVEKALARGHEVTLLHRGRTNADLFPEAEHLLRDRNADLAVLDRRTFDATVDVCAYFPGQVRHLATALDGRGGQHLFVSSVAAYAATRPGCDESAPLKPAPDPPTETVGGSTYGALKAECERVAQGLYGDELTVVRPAYIIGPYDHTGRFPWWVDRIARGGEVLAPTPVDAPFQAVDGRDLGAFMMRLLESGNTGAFHAAAPPPPYSYGDMLQDVADAVAPKGTRFIWLDARWLTDHGLDRRTLPMWDEGAYDWGIAVDPDKAMSNGLEPRSIRESARETLSWLQEGGSLTEGIGLDAGREVALLDEWRATT